MEDKKILIFSGTTEGKQLAYTLAANGIYCDLTVATEYGSMVMDKSPFIKILEGRLDREAMKELYARENYLAVVDATHPFATEVTANIRASLEGSSIPYFRLLRKAEDAKSGDCIYYDNTAECAEALKNTAGNILLTTGSKELAVFTEDISVKKRLFSRVLPVMDSLKLCYDAGLEGKQIIAIQGPFSKEMNLAQIREYDISHLVTKESGRTGGVDSKLEAAREAGIACHVIRRPNTEIQAEGMSHSELIAELSLIFGQKINAVSRIKVTLAGIGMGNTATQTHEVTAAIAKADFVFGAERVIEKVQTKVKKYPYYLEKDILPLLEEEKKYKEDIRAVVLFSGDSGFYSGCKKMYAGLTGREDYDVEILPGLSSLAVMAARIGTDWQDAKIMSAHGLDTALWEKDFVEAVRDNKKTFILTSGVADVRRIGELLENEYVMAEAGLGKKVEKLGTMPKKSIYYAYNLSYADEEVKKVTAKECQKVEKEGLYTVFVIEE